MLVLLLAQALAAPRTDLPVDDALKLKGLTVIEIAKPGSCPDAWSDPAVASWLAAHPQVTPVTAPFTKGSVEKVVGKATVSSVIKVAYLDGREIDRACECLDGDALTNWLTLLDAGGSLAGQRWDRLQAGGAFDTTGWLELVQLEYCANRLDAALDAAVHLWEAIPTEAPDQREIRLTRVAHDLGVLAAKSPEGKVRVEGLRDALTEAKDTERAALDAWVALNRVLNQDELTISWFEAARGKPGSKALVEAQAPNLFYLLAERGKWEEAGQLIDDPKAWLELWKGQTAGVDSAAMGYAALRAAGRDKEAGVVLKEALKVAPAGSSCRFLARSTEVGVAGASEKALLKDCEDPAVVAAWTAAVAQ